MWKRVIRDYFAAFRWEKIKAAYQKSNWWIFINLLFVLPGCWQIYSNAEASARFYLAMVPIAFSLFVLSLYPAMLPKIMYLCPMSWEQRMEYLNKSRWVRILVPLVILIVGLVVLSGMGMAPWTFCIGVFINQILFSIFSASVINENGYGALDVNGKRVMDMDSKTGIFEGGMGVVAVFTAFVYAGIIWDETMPWWGSLLLIAIPAALELPMVIWFCRRWPETVQRVLWFESTQNISKERE